MPKLPKTLTELHAALIDLENIQEIL